MLNKPRGRIPHTTYSKTIATMLVRDWDILDHCDLLTQLSAIEQLVKRYPERFFCPGVAVRYLLKQSIAYVQRTCSQQSPASDRNIAEYLTLRVAGKTVSAIWTNSLPISPDNGIV